MKNNKRSKSTQVTLNTEIISNWNLLIQDCSRFKYSFIFWTPRIIIDGGFLGFFLKREQVVHRRSRSEVKLAWADSPWDKATQRGCRHPGVPWSPVPRSVAIITGTKENGTATQENKTTVFDLTDSWDAFISSSQQIGCAENPFKVCKSYKIIKFNI